MDINKLIQLNRASQNPIELQKLITFVREIDPKVVVEIGSWRGWNLENFERGFDLDFLCGIEIDKNNVDPEVAQSIPIIIGDSHSQEVKDELKTRLEGKQIDFLYIDGDHSYEGVKKDFEMYASLVRKGGIIAFDDVMLTGEKWVLAKLEVNRFWNDLVGDMRWVQKYFIFWDEAGKGTGEGVWVKPY